MNSKMMKLKLPDFISQWEQKKSELMVAKRIISYNMDGIKLPVNIDDYKNKNKTIKITVGQTLIGFIPKAWLKEIKND